MPSWLPFVITWLLDGSPSSVWQSSALEERLLLQTVTLKPEIVAESGVKCYF